MNVRLAGTTGALLLAGLSALSGSGPPREHRAVDVHNRGLLHGRQGDLGKALAG